MRKRIVGLTDAIQNVLANHTEPVWWKTICKEIGDMGLVELEPEQVEVTFNQPNFHHSVRRILTELIHQGKVRRIDRGLYSLAH